MAEYELLNELLGLPNVLAVGYQITGAERVEVMIESTLTAAVCPDCQQLSTRIHDTAEPQMIRDLPIWDRQCWLRYAPQRYACATCAKTFVERVVWRAPGLAYTERYTHYIYERARRENLAQIAHDEGLSQDAVRGIFERGAKKSSPSGATRR